ncbi:MAG: Gfo/Idh/MocA family oxidoreductase [Actinomycetota bacterium]|nr:Gfo/Idh/MocA family oxidoreductase [Actinomycetota bacterium]
MTPTVPPARPVRWGIVATGGIAATMARDLGDVDDAVRHAVASRDRLRAQAFAEEHGFARAYGAYEELLADPDVDVVYVATPHRQHHAVALAAIEAGKPILVEKAFTVTVAGAADVLDLARECGVFAMEAMWTRFLPIVSRIRELVAGGAVGEVRSLSADLGFVREMDRWDRLWDKDQGGGAVLDLGVYPISFAQMILGDPVRVQVTGAIGPTGVETGAGLLLDHALGARAMIDCSMVTPLAGRVSITGTGGRIDIPPRFHHPARALLVREGAEPEELRAEGELATVGHGFAHQVREVQRCLRAGLLESPVMPRADTLSVMRTMESALRGLGVEHSEDPDVLLRT